MPTQSQSPAPDQINAQEYNVAYWRLRPFWIEVINLLEPLVDGLGQYLTKYPKEDDGEFIERLRRIAQVNFANLFTDAYTSMLHSTDIQVTSIGLKDEVQSFVDCCNLQGDSLVDFYAETVTPLSLGYGTLDVFVDLPQTSSEVLTLADEQKFGLNKPYAYIVPPINRLVWSLDDAKQYVLYRSQDVLNEQVASTMNIKDPKQYITWDLKTITYFNNEGKQTKARDNPYGFIPAVTVIPKPSKRYYDDRIGVSLIQDIIHLQKVLINVVSLLQDWQINANYQMRVIIQDTEAGEPPSAEELQEGGNRRGIVLKGKYTRYELPSPSSAGPEAMRAFLADVIEWMHRSVYMACDPTENKTHQSQATIRANRDQLRTNLVRISKHTAKSMKRLVEMSLRVRGFSAQEVEAAKVSVQWGTNFSYDAAINAIEEVTALRSAIQDISPAMVTEFAKKALIPHVYDSSRVEEIMADLTKWKGIPEPIAEPADDPDNLPDLQKQNTEVSAANKIEEAEG